ncbi:MAG: sel1 repeat family protein [Desulfovibrionaceae bacterium]|nr:sel1 repeat family protein [Desulfovibrionaceae bacterium]
MSGYENGNTDAQTLCGVFYREGIGLEKNITKACEWLKKKAAEKGNSNAQYELGQYYFSVENYAEAVKLFNISSNNKSSKAQFMLGVCYIEGYGVNKSPLLAKELFKLSALQGYVLAQYRLGVCYLEGIGCEVDNEKVASWIHKAANIGLPQAQYDLHLIYKNGIGVYKDINQSFYWLKKASKNNYPDARYDLAQIVEENDKEEVYKLYKEALNFGCNIAKQKVEELKNILRK